MSRLCPFLILIALASGCMLGSGELEVQQPEEPIVINLEDDENGMPDSLSPTPSTVIPSDPTCDEGELRCDDVCTPVLQDDANCGGCGLACDGYRVCIAGACACEVGEFCADACVDTTANVAHCGACDQACSGGEACVAGDCVALTEVEGVVIAVNNARASGASCGSRGTFAPAPPVEGDPNLHLAAQVHADDMAANNFFSHTGSDGSSFGQRVARTNFQGQPISENIAAGGQTAEGTVNQWLNSDGHCANMMNPNATKLGVGYAVGGPYGTSWVQVFAR